MPFGFNFSAAKNLVSGAVNVAAKAAEQAAAVAETAASAAVETASAAASAVVDVAPAPEAAPAPVQQPAAPKQVPQQAAGPRPSAARPVAPRQGAPTQVRPAAPVQRTPQQPAPLQPPTPQQFPPVRSGPPTPLPGSPGGLRSPRPGGPNGARPRGPPFGPGSPRGLPGGPRMMRGPRPPGQLGSPRTPGGTPIRAVRPGGPSGPPQSPGMQRPRAPFNPGVAGQEQNNSNPQVDLTQLNQQERQHIEQVMNKAAQDTLQPQGYNQIDQNQFNADPNQQMPGQNQLLTNQDESMMRQNPPMNQDQSMMNQDPSMMNQDQSMMNQDPSMMNQGNNMTNQGNNMMNQGNNIMNQSSLRVNQNNSMMNQDSSLMIQGNSMMNQDPSMMNQGSRMMNQDPSMMNQGSHMINQDPPMMDQGYHMLNQDPSMMNQGSHMMNQGNNMMNQGNNVMNQDPEIMIQRNNMMNPNQPMMDPEPMMGPPMNGPNQAMMIGQNQATHQNQSMMGQPIDIDQNGGIMGPEQNFMNNNMVYGQYNGPSSQDPQFSREHGPQDPQFSREHGPNGFIPNGSVPFGPSGDCQQRLSPDTCDNPYGSDLNLDNECMDGPGGMGNTSEYSITLDSINKLADDYTKIKEELLADLEDDESVKSDFSEKDFAFSVDSSSSGRNRDLINSPKLHDLLVSGPSLQKIRRPKRITQVSENISIQIHSPCTTPTQGGVQGLKRPDQLIPLNSQLKQKQMKDENKPESHPNLPKPSSSNDTTIQEAKSVMQKHVTKPVQKMESPVTAKMGGTGVAHTFVGNGPVKLQMPNALELANNIAIPTTSSNQSKQQQNIISNQLTKQSYQREYTKPLPENEEQKHIVKDRIRSYENSTHSEGLVLNLENGIQQSSQQSSIKNVNEMPSKQPNNPSKTKIIRQSELVSTGTSPVHEDVPLNKIRPKTRIIYDMGTPEMCSQGIHASIPVTTDKYTYTITSVLTATGLKNPPTTQTSTSKGSKPSVRSTGTGYGMMPSDEFNSLFNNQCNRNPSYNSDLDSPPLYLNQREGGIGVMSPPLPSTHQVYLNNSENYERHTKSDCKHSSKQGPPVRGASSQPGRPGTADGALSPIPDVSPSLEAAESLGFNHQDRGRERGRSYEEHRGRGQDDQDESISGVLNNFSKALGDIREIREKRMQSLGPLVKQSEDSKKSMNGPNQFQQNQHHNQQQQQMQRFPQQNQQQPYNNQQRQQQYGQNKQQQQPQYGQQQQNYRQQQNFQQSGFQQQQQMQPPPPAGTILQQPQQQVQQVSQTSGIVLAHQPVQQQQLVQQQPGVQLMQVPQQTGQPIVIYSSAELTAPTPALISAPTPSPLVVNSSIPMSSTAYTFDPSSLSASQQLALIQSQQQHQQQHLKKMRQRLPHVSGRELQTLHKQIKDLQHKQHQQTLQTLRLAQVQEKQAFKYLDSALKTRQMPKNSYSHSAHRVVGFNIKGKSGSPGKKFDPLPAAALLQSSTLVATPDTLSESGSIKSARSRSRTLPFLPPEEPAPLPSQAKKAQDRMRSYGKMRQSSLDGITGMPPKSYSSFGRPRPSNSETNLRKLALEERNRPVSALGLLQASSVISSHGPSQAAKEHEKRILENILPPDLRHLIRGGGGSSYSFQNIRQQIENDLKGGVSSNTSGPSAGEIARLNAEKKLFGVQSERIRAEMQRYAATKDPRLRAEMKHKLNPVMDNQLSRTRRMRGHRRNLSDGRITTSLTDSMGDDTGFSSLPNRPFSSLSGGHLDSYDYGTDNSQSYLFEGLRESSVPGYGLTEEEKFRAYNNPRMMQRRSSLGGGGMDSALYDYGNNPEISTMNRRPHSSMSGKLGQGSLGPGARSWHPSPLHSDEETEEHQFFKEEKKNRIKMEISRRRNQIEENARLHEELIRLAKLRETAEMGGGEINRLHVTGYNNSPNISPGRDGTGVLRSVDEILRNDHQNFSSFGSSSARIQSGRRDLGRHGYEDDLLVSGPGMGMDRYNVPVYDSTRKPQRLTDFSPVNSDLADFNHHYSDSGRSRKFDEYGNFNSSSSNYNAGMGNFNTGSNNFNPGMSFNSNGRYGRHNLYR